MDRAQTRVKLNWIKPYREGLLMAMYVDDETGVRRLIEWPGTDLPVDDGLENLTAGDNVAHTALAFLLRGEPEARLSAVVDKIRATKRKRASVFWAAAEAIAAKEPRIFALRMKELCDLYLKSASDRPTFPIPHIDGSILWHVARRCDIAVPELADSSLDRILR